GPGAHAVGALLRPDPPAAQLPRPEHRRLLLPLPRDDDEHLRVHRRGRRPRLSLRPVDGGLDPVLLGLVDRLGALREPVPGPHLARPHPAPVRRGRAADPVLVHPAVGVDLRQRRPAPCSRVSGLSGCSPSCPSGCGGAPPPPPPYASSPPIRSSPSPSTPPTPCSPPSPRSPRALSPPSRSR